jgi:hypothetical protein
LCWLIGMNRWTFAGRLFALYLEYTRLFLALKY